MCLCLSPRCHNWICWSLEGLSWAHPEDRACAAATGQCQALSAALAERLLWAGTASFKRIHFSCPHKRAGEAMKGGLEKAISPVYTPSGCSTNTYNSHGNQLALPVSSGTGSREVREELEAYFYLISFILVWKQAFITLCFENTLTDTCRTIQGESVSGNMFLRMAEIICLCFFAEWKDYRINQHLPTSEDCSSLSVHLPHQFTLYMWFLFYPLFCKWSFL